MQADQGRRLNIGQGELIAVISLELLHVHRQQCPPRYNVMQVDAGELHASCMLDTFDDFL